MNLYYIIINHMGLLIISMFLLLYNLVVYSKEGILYLKNGNILNADIYIKSEKIIVARFENVLMEFNRNEIKKIVFNERNKKKKFLNQSELENQYDDIIMKYAYKYKVSPYLIKAIIKVESNFDPKNISKKGAMGLMQLMPETAKKLNVKNVFDPEENIDAGIKYFVYQLNKYQGDLEKSLAAYNAGPMIVDKYSDVPPYKETIDYLYNVKKYYNKYKNANSKKVYSFYNNGKLYIYNER